MRRKLFAKPNIYASLVGFVEESLCLWGGGALDTEEGIEIQQGAFGRSSLAELAAGEVRM